MNRYATTKKKSDKEGKSVYGTTYYPTIPIENGDQFIVTSIGSRLDNIAHKFYGDFTLWWIIAKANGIRGKTALEPGIRIRIPGNVSQIVGKFVEMNKSG